MNQNLTVVTNRIFLLGLDDLYRTAMKCHESTELLKCAREVASVLGVEAADVPIEGYYTESAELTEYFRLVRSLQAEPKNRQVEVTNSPEFSRLIEVTSSPLFGTPAASDSLLPAGVDPLTTALDRTSLDAWSIENLTNTAYDVVIDSEDFSLVGLAALSRDSVTITALRESVVLYAAIALGAIPSEPEYVWEVDEVIEHRALRFVETFNLLFSENLPIPSPDNARFFAAACDEWGVMGRCVSIALDDGVNPTRHYHWAINQNKKYELEVEEFWDDQLWTTEKYRRLKVKDF